MHAPRVFHATSSLPSLTPLPTLPCPHIKTECGAGGHVAQAADVHPRGRLHGREAHLGAISCTPAVYPCCSLCAHARSRCWLCSLARWRPACRQQLLPGAYGMSNNRTAPHDSTNGLQDVIADETLRVMRRCVPAAVPGIMFLSGGQVGARAAPAAGDTGNFSIGQPDDKRARVSSPCCACLQAPQVVLTDPPTAPRLPHTDGGGGDREPERHQPAGAAAGPRALEPQLLIWPLAAGGRLVVWAAAELHCSAVLWI